MASLSRLNMFQMKYQKSILFISIFNMYQHTVSINCCKRSTHMNSINTAVMLSQPTSSLVYLATKESSKFFKIRDPSLPIFLSLPILVTMGWLSLTYFYQIPSHPMIINSSSAERLTSVTSGLQMIGCSSQFFPLTFL